MVAAAVDDCDYVCQRSRCAPAGWQGAHSGGQTGVFRPTSLASAELWDPAMQAWAALPSMAHERDSAAACLLPSGRAAVLGGYGADRQSRKDGEVFNLRRDNGSRCPAEMAHDHGHIPAVAPVSGGMLVAGGSSGSITELYEEVSGRWCQLPHVQMVERCRITRHGLSLGASGSSVG